MNNVISFVRGSQIRPINESDRICYVIQPFIQEVLDRFIESHNLGTAIEQAATKHEEVAKKFFDINYSNVEESFSLKQEFLFPQENPLLALHYSNTLFPSFLGKSGTKIIKDESILPDIHNLLYLCAQSNLSYDQICQQISEPTIELLDKLIKCSIVKEREHQKSSVPPETPGVFRLQHAGLLYRTKTTGILVDPHLHSNYGIPQLKSDISRAQLEGSVDGILISHPHYDHWHYPTLMMFAPETPIFVPKVPRATIMCEDMEARLKSLGFTNVIAVDWYAEPIAIGDIEIHVLPFYGEQPLVPEFARPIHPDLRNWGNTYLLRTEYYTSWFLIDAGQEPMKSMFEVAEYVKEKIGTVDLLLSNFQPLSYNSIGTNLSGWGIDIVANLLSNPQIFSVTNKEEGEYVALLGPKGVAKVCAIVGAKACLPYAHSWAEIGQPGVNDEQLIAQVEAELKNLGASTQVIPWKIGDGYAVKNGEVRDLAILEGALS
ncbi:MAG: MBL fold metallo-hydrolase [Prochloraceae cyanobacterium]|nr:MBL fold metallo-hydrolase [Prochloraceae cyanobacterium]